MNISAINNYNNKSTNFTSLNLSKGLSAGYDKLTDKLATGLGKVIDTPTMQNLADKFYKNDNIATHIFSATGILLTSFFILSTSKNKKIEEERKKPLMINSALSCAFATVGGYTIDKMLNKPLNKFADTFKAQNANNPNLHKYLTGIKIAKSALVFGMLYKFVVPVVSTFLAEKYVEKEKKN